MNINLDLLLKIVKPIIAFFRRMAKNLFEGKEKLIAYYGHFSSFKLKADSPGKLKVGLL